MADGVRDRLIDLDSASAARAEQRRKPVAVTFGGERFELPPEVPFEFIDAFESGNLGGAVRALFGDGHAAFMAHGPTLQDIEELAKQLPRLYGVSLGESRASGGSSRRTSPRSRPTSNGGTG